MFDWCVDGQRLNCLTVTDEWTKEGLAIEVDGRIRSARVIEVLARLVSSAARRSICAPTTGPSSSRGRF
jgi:putative transposase